MEDKSNSVILSVRTIDTKLREITEYSEIYYSLFQRVAIVVFVILFEVKLWLGRSNKTPTQPVD